MSSFTCTLHNMTPEELAESIAEQRKKEIIDEIATKNAGRAEGRAEREIEIAAAMRADGVPEEFIRKYLKGVD